MAALWDLADSGAAADALLDALLADGLSSLDHFALVAHDDDSTHLIVRGAPSPISARQASGTGVSGGTGSPLTMPSRWVQARGTTCSSA